jgi:hypothetical protein
VSESDGIDEVVDGSLRQSLMAAARLGETLARMRQESLRRREEQDFQARQDVRRRVETERSAMQSVLAPVQKDEWWKHARPHDIAQAHALAEGWKDYDPQALTAAERIRSEVHRRYSIDTHDVGADTAYLESGIETMDAAQEARRAAVAEHQKAMALIAAAQAEELQAKAKNHAAELAMHQKHVEEGVIPVQWLKDPLLVEALQSAHDARAALKEVEAKVEERLNLLSVEGSNGPTIDSLRLETTSNFSGVREEHFKDPRFVEAAKEWYETKILAYLGLKGPQDAPVQQRYERAEAELFARIEDMGRELENRVTGDAPLKDQAEKAENNAAAEYGSAYHQAFAASLAGTASEDQVQGRVAAARSEGTHPATALTQGKGAAKARKIHAGAGVGVERTKNGPSR